MHVHVLLALGPLNLDIIVAAQLGRIVRESLPGPSFGCGWIFNPQPAVALESARDQEPPLACRMPEAFGAIPRIEQDMGHCPGDRFKSADHGFHQVDFAGERDSFSRADRLLSIQLGSQRTASPQQHIQALDQAMASHALVLRRRVMQTQSLHLLAFAFLDRRVIPDQIPCHDGQFGTALTFWLLSALSLHFSSYFRLTLLPKLGKPDFDHSCRLPGGLREKTTQPCQARSIRNLTQQPLQRSPSFTEHQSQQHDDEVLILGLGELVTKAFGKLPQGLIQTYNGNWHRTPPWFQGSIFFSLISHGVLSRYFPFQKCKHRE